MKVELPHKFFRPDTLVEPQIVGFVVAQGGLGDCIGLSTAIVYIAKHYKNVIGQVFTHDFFIPIMQNFLQDYPEWKVFDVKTELTQEFINNHPIKYPTPDPIGRLGANAIDLGFIYYLNMLRPQFEKYYEELSLSSKRSISESVPYVVLTPVSTNKQKEMIPECFNKIKKSLIRRNHLPVLIGKGNFNSKYDTSGTFNLVNSTSLLEAASFIFYSKCIVGIDNGLLHLASCVPNSRIVWGHTISDPEHSTYLNYWGIKHIIPKELPCRFCQSNMRFFTDKNNIHNFNDGCFYKEEIPECVSERHLGDPKRWIKAIEYFL